MESNGATATVNGNAAIIDAVHGLCERGAMILPCDGKRPIHDGWQHRTYTAVEIVGELRRVANPTIGLRFGPGSYIDIEADSPDEERAFAELFAGCDLPITPTFASTRGKHRLFRWDDRLAETGAAVVSYRGTNGAKLGIRIGAGDKGAQSIIPPSPGRTWLVSWDDCEPAALPDVVIARILAAANPKPAAKPSTASTNGHATPAALEAMLRHRPAPNENDGSGRLLAVCCRAVEHDLSDASAVATIRQYKQQHPFPADWTDADILRRLRDAERKATRGAALENPSRHTTDVGNAERFAEQHGADVRYCHPWSKWLVWDGRRWGIDDSGEVMRRAKLTARSIYGEAARAIDKHEAEALAKWASGSERRERLTAMIALAESEQPIPIAVETLDAEPWLLNCENGTVDLRTGELRKHRRDDYLTKLCAVEYLTEPGIDPELWITFLDHIFNGNAKLIGFLQRLVGMALVGEVLEHILPIFYGVGANGKSVFLETVCGMLGPDYAMNAPAGLLMASRSDKHPTELADLHGKRFVAAVETADGGRLSEALVKELTGGDSIRARRMREDFWQFRPSHSVVLATNHRPTIRGTDHGIWRRIRLVPFIVTIPDSEQDKHLAAKLRNEWPAILRWAVAGCLEWQRGGLQAPDEVVEATDDYRADMDVLGEFIEERCILGDGCEARASDLYRSYKAWSEKRGEYVETQTKFGSRLGERGLSKARDSGNRVVYRGIGLFPEGPDSSEGFSV